MPDDSKPPVIQFSDQEPLSGLIPGERIALTVARRQLERGDNPPINITTVLVMAIDRLLEELRAAKQAGAERDEALAEVTRLRSLVRTLENSGDRIGFAVVTYNQASHWPGFDYSDLHTELEDAVNERDYKRDETKKIGRAELHVVAEVVELREGDDA